MTPYSPILYLVSGSYPLLPRKQADPETNVPHLSLLLFFHPGGSGEGDEAN
jgi:hypothetical protein